MQDHLIDYTITHLYTRAYTNVSFFIAEKLDIFLHGNKCYRHTHLGEVLAFLGKREFNACDYM